MIRRRRRFGGLFVILNIYKPTGALYVRRAPVGGGDEPKINWLPNPICCS